MPSLSLTARLSAALLLVLAAAAAADDSDWTQLSRGEKALDAWAAPTDDWLIAGDAALDPKNPRRLTGKDGKGVLVANGAGGRAHNLVTREVYQDVEVHLEFMIGKGSNSGVKLMGLYEIQIFDSHGKKELTGNDCGGIYPRAEEKPQYHYLDKGVAPKVNAARPAGEWQTLDIAFRAPRFGDDGKKTADARFVKVVLNGKVVHEDVAVECPTGAAWRLKKEVAKGPLLLQGDHGPVAFRDVRIRPLDGGKKKD